MDMKKLSRRAALAAPLALMTPAFQAGQESYGGFAIDLSLAPEATRAATLASLRAQIDLVNSLKIRADILDWFRSVPLVVDPSIRGPGEFRNGRLALKDVETPADNPLLLHELLHGWHFQKMPDRRRNPEILAFYDQAKASGAFPARSYMLSNVVEFFAMTASVALWGRAARPPRTRERLRQVMPAYYDWLVEQFGLQV
ncbi:MAG: hypothetical protein ACK4MI_11805 [Brevundimonas sp.]